MFVYTLYAHNDQYVNILKARTKISANRDLDIVRINMAALHCFPLTYFGTDPAGLGSVHIFLGPWSMVHPFHNQCPDFGTG